MASAKKRFRGVNLEARQKAFGQIYVWLYRRHDAIQRDLAANTPALWVITAQKMGNHGVRSIHGLTPSPNAVRLAWRDVALHYPEDSKRYEAERDSNTSHVSRRHKGWVPMTSPHRVIRVKS